MHISYYLFESRFEVTLSLACLIKAEIVPRILGDIINQLFHPMRPQWHNRPKRGDYYGAAEGRFVFLLAYKEQGATTPLPTLSYCSSAQTLEALAPSIPFPSLKPSPVIRIPQQWPMRI